MSGMIRVVSVIIIKYLKGGSSLRLGCLSHRAAGLKLLHCLHNCMAHIWLPASPVVCLILTIPVSVMHSACTPRCSNRHLTTFHRLPPPPCVPGVGFTTPLPFIFWSFLQKQIALLGLAGSVGTFFALPAGIFYDRYGPKLTATVGGTIAFSGWMGQWLILSGRAPSAFDPSEHQTAALIALCLCFAWGSLSCAWYDAVSVITSMHNFPPRERSLVCGIPKAFNGLGASVFATLYVAFFLGNGPSHADNEDSIIHYLLFVPIVLVSFAAISSVVVDTVPTHQRDRKPQVWVLSFGLALTVLISIYLGASSLAHATLLEHDPAAMKAIAVGMLGLMLCYFMMPIAVNKGFACLSFSRPDHEDHEAIPLVLSPPKQPVVDLPDTSSMKNFSRAGCCATNPCQGPCQGPCQDPSEGVQSESPVAPMSSTAVSGTPLHQVVKSGSFWMLFFSVSP